MMEIYLTSYKKAIGNGKLEKIIYYLTFYEYIMIS